MDDPDKPLSSDEAVSVESSEPTEGDPDAKRDEALVADAEAALESQREMLLGAYRTHAEQTGATFNPEVSLEELTEWWRQNAPEVAAKRAAQAADKSQRFDVLSDLIFDGYKASKLPAGNNEGVLEIGPYSFRVTQRGKWLSCTYEGALLDPEFTLLPEFPKDGLRFSVNMSDLATYFEYNPSKKVSCELTDENQYLKLKRDRATHYLPLSAAPAAASDYGPVTDKFEIDPVALADALTFIAPYASLEQGDPRLNTVQLSGGAARAIPGQACYAEYRHAALDGVELSVHRSACRSLISVLRRMRGSATVETHEEVYVLRGSSYICVVKRHIYTVPPVRPQSTTTARIKATPLDFGAMLSELATPDHPKDKPAITADLRISRDGSTIEVNRNYTIRDRAGRVKGEGIGNNRMKVEVETWDQSSNEIRLRVQFRELVAFVLTPDIHAIYLELLLGINGKEILRLVSERKDAIITLILAPIDETKADRLR